MNTKAEALNEIVEVFWCGFVDSITVNMDLYKYAEEYLSVHYDDTVDFYPISKAYEAWLKSIEPPKVVRSEVKRLIGPDWYSYYNKNKEYEEAEDIVEFYSEELLFKVWEGERDGYPNDTHDVLLEWLPGFIDSYMTV